MKYKICIPWLSILFTWCNVTIEPKRNYREKNDYFLESLGDVYMKLLLILPENGCGNTGTAEVFNLKEYLSLFFYNTIFDLIMLNCK